MKKVFAAVLGSVFFVSFFGLDRVAMADVKVSCETVGSFRATYRKTVEFSLTSDAKPVQASVYSKFLRQIEVSSAAPVIVPFDSGDASAADFVRYALNPAAGADENAYFLALPKGNPSAISRFSGLLDILFAQGQYGWVRMELDCRGGQ